MWQASRASSPRPCSRSAPRSSRSISFRCGCRASKSRRCWKTSRTPKQRRHARFLRSRERARRGLEVGCKYFKGGGAARARSTTRLDAPQGGERPARVRLVSSLSLSVSSRRRFRKSVRVSGGPLKHELFVTAYGDTVSGEALRALSPQPRAGGAGGGGAGAGGAGGGGAGGARGGGGGEQLGAGVAVYLKPNTSLPRTPGLHEIELTGGWFLEPLTRERPRAFSSSRRACRFRRSRQHSYGIFSELDASSTIYALHSRVFAGAGGVRVTMIARVDPRLRFVPSWLVSFVLKQIVHRVIPMMARHAKRFEKGGSHHDRISARPELYDEIRFRLGALAADRESPEASVAKPRPKPPPAAAAAAAAAAKVERPPCYERTLLRGVQRLFLATVLLLLLLGGVQRGVSRDRLIM